ncbi:MAG: aspartate aminotransferase family protein [Synechococcus sp. Tobar2m-G35]|jgi:L-2,4-diaminobutyrate decarboxylase|nr:aspartate aminotransferase family protein [Synechococcus sp. Tobar2m-G35]
MIPSRSPALVLSPAEGHSTALSPFAAPHGVDGALVSFLHDCTGLLGRWLAEAADQGVRPLLSLQPPAEPEVGPLSEQRLLSDLQGLMGGAFRPNHPGALAHLDPPALTVSMAAELLAAGLNNNLLAEELSPSLSRLERGLCRWLAQRLGLGPRASGVPASGGSLSNLMALVCARRAAGLAHDPRAVVVAAAGAHVSLAKALGVMGLPADALVAVPAGDDGRLDPALVADTLRHLHRQGRPVLALVGTAGTTVQGLVDPLADLADLCRDHGLWFHVDGAIGAVCALVDDHRWRVRGLERADSVTLNPQKLLGVSKPSSLLLLRDPTHLEASFATGLPYMEAPLGGVQGGELGLQGTRGAEVLKLWLCLRHLGLTGISDLIGAAMARAASLRSALAGSDLSCLAGDLHLVAIAAPNGSHDRHGWRDTAHALLLREGFWLSRPDVAGQPLLKAVFGNPYTSPQHIQRLAELLRSTSSAEVSR